MSKNMSLWQTVCHTDPIAVKAITGKSYQGNSPKPYWLIEQATKKFGPCGIGWGVEVIRSDFNQVGPDDFLHTAIVRVWYEYEGKRGQVEQAGGTKAAYKTKTGSLMVDEDAAKKSVTDGMVKCLSMLGFAGDIFSGRWDDSKYVQEMREHFDDERHKELLITEEQKANIAALAKEVGADMAGFCKWLKVNQLDDLLKANYDHAITALERKRNQTA